jgi:hypothetical protein
VPLHPEHGVSSFLLPLSEVPGDGPARSVSRALTLPWGFARRVGVNDELGLPALGDAGLIWVKVPLVIRSTLRV